MPFGVNLMRSQLLYQAAQHQTKDAWFALSTQFDQLSSHGLNNREIDNYPISVCFLVSSAPAVTQFGDSMAFKALMSVGLQMLLREPHLEDLKFIKS